MTRHICVCLLLIAFAVPRKIHGKEPQCSRFPYEEKMLEKMIRTEIKCEEMAKETALARDKVTSTVDNIDAKMKAFEERFANLQATVEDEIKNLQTIKGNAKHQLIAFNVYGIKDKTMSGGTKMIFTDAIMNHGDGYETATGVFTAPVDGLYWFSVYLCGQSRQSIEYSIVQQGKKILFGLTYEPSGTTCSSASVTTVMNAGERLWIENHNSNTLYENSYEENTFTGAMLYSI